MGNLTAGNIRALVRRAIACSGGGHAGGSLSMAEILASLYGSVLRHDPQNPGWPERDRLVLSKGHSGLGLYAALALCGYFPEEELDRFGAEGARLMNHPNAHNTPGVELSTGSLGHGLSIACGMALSAKLRGEEHFVCCVLGDGECQEGSVWEAAMLAAQHRLDRLVAIVDRNRIGNDGPIDAVVTVEPFADKWRAFGWKAREVDGHDEEAVTRALLEMKWEGGGPHVLIARTVKGKGLREGVAGTGKSHYIKGSPEQVAELFGEREAGRAEP